MVTGLIQVIQLIQEKNRVMKIEFSRECFFPHLGVLRIHSNLELFTWFTWITWISPVFMRVRVIQVEQSTWISQPTLDQLSRFLEVKV